MKRIALLLALFIPFLITAQSLAVKGSVFERNDFNKTPLKNVQIEILNNDDIIIGTGESNNEGLFRIFIQDKYRHKEIRFIASSPGYYTHKSSDIYRVEGHEIELVGIVLQDLPVNAEERLPDEGAEIVRLRRDAYGKGLEIARTREEIKLLNDEITRLKKSNDYSAAEVSRLNNKIKVLSNLLRDTRNSKRSIMAEATSLREYIKFLENENDSLIRVIDMILAAEKKLSGIYINKLEVYAANNRSKFLSKKPSATDKFDKWEKTIVVLDVEQSNADPLDEEIRFILKIQHIETGEFMNYAEGDGNDSVSFYYKEGEKQIVFDNYNSKNEYYGSPEFMVMLLYDNGTDDMRIVHKKRLTLKN